MRAGMMLNCDINRVTTFDKKATITDLQARRRPRSGLPIANGHAVDIETS